MRANRAGTLARSVPQHSLVGLGFPVERAVPAVVIAGTVRRVDVPLYGRLHDAPALGRQERLSAVVVGDVLPVHIDVVVDDVGFRLIGCLGTACVYGSSG